MYKKVGKEAYQSGENVWHLRVSTSALALPNTHLAKPVRQ